MAAFVVDVFAYRAMGERFMDIWKTGRPHPASSNMMKYVGTELNKRRHELVMSGGGSEALEWDSEETKGGARARLAAHQGQFDRRRDELSHAQRYRQADFGFAGGLRPQPPFFLRRDRAEAKPETKARLEGPCTTPNPSRRHFDKLNGSSGRTEFSDYAALSQ